jgi:hypothetical protein
VSRDRDAQELLVMIVRDSGSARLPASPAR